MSQRYGEHGPDGSRYWQIERIWQLAEDLPIEDIPIDVIRGPDEVTWFSPEQPPTCRAIAEHCRRIQAADLSYPVILTEDFRVFDGMHRIAKCLMLGHATIRARRFRVNPAPDQIVLHPAE